MSTERQQTQPGPQSDFAERVTELLGEIYDMVSRASMCSTLGPALWENLKKSPDAAMHELELRSEQSQKITELIEPFLLETPDDSRARLIAAAPELLEACEAMVAAYKHIPIPDHGTDASSDLWDARQQLESAIAKAKGTNP